MVCACRASCVASDGPRHVGRTALCRRLCRNLQTEPRRMSCATVDELRHEREPHMSGGLRRIVCRWTAPRRVDCAASDGLRRVRGLRRVGGLRCVERSTPCRARCTCWAVNVAFAELRHVGWYVCLTHRIMSDGSRHVRWATLCPTDRAVSDGLRVSDRLRYTMHLCACPADCATPCVSARVKRPRCAMQSALCQTHHVTSDGLRCAVLCGLARSCRLCWYRGLR